MIFNNKLLRNLLTVTLAFSYGLSEVSSQELLPRDNTFLTYHKAPRYRGTESHPLRLIAYVVHPIGWALREGVFRPLSYFAGSTETTRSVMGFREPFDYREPHCFSSSDDVPDCKALAPYNNIRRSSDDVEAMDESPSASLNQVYFPDVNFDFNKSTLNDLGVGRVHQIAALIKTVPNMNIVVEGHTDFKGTDEYNNKLGEARANAVISELKNLGVETEILSPISYGESKPLLTEETDWARAVNRRVQFTLGAANGNTELAASKPTLPSSDVDYE